MPEFLKPYRKLLVFLAYGVVMLVSKWWGLGPTGDLGELADVIVTGIGAVLLWWFPNDPLPEKDETP